jgi:hypothetical protein
MLTVGGVLDCKPTDVAGHKYDNRYDRASWSNGFQSKA